jgi:CDP-archaeol synthase
MAAQIHVGLILQLTILLTLANSSPVVAKRIFGERFSFPVDAGLELNDGRPLFGPSKTVRGVLSSLVVTSIGSALMGQGFALGALVSVTAMIGDMTSSFIKRRLGFPSSSRATGLDQVPESLFPLLACRYFVPLGVLDMASIVVIFVAGGIILSPLLHLVRIRDEPY